MQCPRTGCDVDGVYPHVVHEKLFYCLACAREVNDARPEGLEPIVVTSTLDVVRVLRVKRNEPFDYNHWGSHIEMKAQQWERFQEVNALAERLFASFPADELAKRIALLVWDES